MTTVGDCASTSAFVGMGNGDGAAAGVVEDGASAGTIALEDGAATGVAATDVFCFLADELTTCKLPTPKMSPGE